MSKKKTIREKYQDWLYEHFTAKLILENSWSFIVSTVSAFLFAFGFAVFLAPSVTDGGEILHKIVSGGMSGLSQLTTLAIELVFPHAVIDESLSYSILYFSLNVPVIILAWFGIGKRFTIYTLINVLEVSIFTRLLSLGDMQWLHSITLFMNQNGGMLCRALFAGVFTGLSSALAFKADFSSGGIDVIAYYIALKKNTMVGKYSALLNSVITVVFALLTATKYGWNNATTIAAFGGIFYSFLYMLTSTLLIDTINVRNRKMKIEVVTKQKELAGVLINSIPHAATITQGEGAFSGETKFIITMVVSSFEVKDVVRIIREDDPESFIQVETLNQVYGRFFMKPVR